MQTSVDDSGILPRYRESLSQGSPCKGLAPGWVTPSIASSLPHKQGGLRCAFQQALPVIFTIKLLAKMSQALFLMVHGGGHTTNTFGVVLQDYKPC